MVNYRKEAKKGSMIGIIGLLAAGKSELTRVLSKVIREDSGSCEELYEPASKTNPFLSLFYEDPRRWGAFMQVYLLTCRLEQHRFAQAMALSGRHSVSDSLIHSDTCFASMLEKDGVINKDEADVYFRLFQNMTRELLYPSAVIYLKVDATKSIQRIEKRMSEKAGRKCEAGVSLEYLRNLSAEYEELSANLSRFCHVVRVDWNEDRDEQGIEKEARKIWDHIKMLKEINPIPCQMGL